MRFPHPEHIQCNADNLQQSEKKLITITGWHMTCHKHMKLKLKGPIVKSNSQ